MSKAKKGQRAEVLRILRDGPRKDEPMTDLTKVPDHAAAIHKAGGPAWFGWCDIEKQSVCGSGGITRDMKWVVCPPACEAAVLAYALKVSVWLERLDKGNHAIIHPTDLESQWMVELYGDSPDWPDTTHTYTDELAAAEALIVAVAGEVEK